VSSAYAITEAVLNLDELEMRARLYRLIQKIEIADEPPAGAELPSDIELPQKDVPIMLAAIHARSTHLLTGDRKHFGRLFGRTVKNVRILTVHDYLTGRDPALLT
jgi:hypothetical protein